MSQTGRNGSDHIFMPSRCDDAWAPTGYSAARSLARLGPLCADGRASVTIGDLADALGRSAMGMLLLVLTMPALIPLPGPFGMVFGTLIAFLAVQLIFGRRRVWLPHSVRNRRLTAGVVDAMVAHGTPVLARLERWLQPRRMLMLTGLRGRILTGLPILVMAIALALPIPLGNPLPAAALFAFALGLTMRDGVAILVGLGLSIAAVAWMVVLWFVGSALLDQVALIWAPL